MSVIESPVMGFWKRQYNDIKGNLKFALLTWLIAGSGLTWIAHIAQAAWHTNIIASYLALAAPIFSILAVGYLLVVLTPKSLSNKKPQMSLPVVPVVPLQPKPVDLQGEMIEVYFYRPGDLIAFSKTYVLMKVQIVNRGPDEATITRCGLHVELGGFGADGEVLNIPSDWRVEKRVEHSISIVYSDYQIEPRLGEQAHSEVYKKGHPREGWLAFEFYLFEGIEFPNAQLDLLLKDSLGGEHRIRRVAGVYPSPGRITVAPKNNSKLKV